MKIARDWNVPASGSGYVTVQREQGLPVPLRGAGRRGRAHREYWIPAEDMDTFNAAIVGEIEVVREFR